MDSASMRMIIGAHVTCDMCKYMCSRVTSIAMRMHARSCMHVMYVSYICICYIEHAFMAVVINFRCHSPPPMPTGIPISNEDGRISCRSSCGKRMQPPPRNSKVCYNVNINVYKRILYGIYTYIGIRKDVRLLVVLACTRTHVQTKVYVCARVYTYALEELCPHCLVGK